MENLPSQGDIELADIQEGFMGKITCKEIKVERIIVKFCYCCHSVVSDSSQPHGLQHTRLPCPSPTPRSCSNSCPSCRWCHPTVSSSVIPFFSCLQSFPASESFPVSQLFASCHQSTGASASASVLPMNYSGLISFRIDWLDLLAVQGTLRSLIQHHSSKVSILQHSTFFIVQLSHPHMTIGKTIPLTRWTFVGKVMSLLFDTLSRLVIAFLLRIKCLLISLLQSPSAVILEPKKIPWTVGIQSVYLTKPLAETQCWATILERILETECALTTIFSSLR